MTLRTIAATLDTVLRIAADLWLLAILVLLAVALAWWLATWPRKRERDCR